MRRTPSLLTVLAAIAVISTSQVAATSASPASNARLGIPHTGHVSLRIGFEDLDQYVVSAMLEWGVPGLALAVIEEGRIVVSRGYGYRDLGNRLPTTPETLFAVSSLTKSFTTTALAMLVDEGLVDWDEPVKSYLQDFELHDPIATNELTLRELLTHRSGLPRHDMVWYGANLSRLQLYERLRYLQPSGPHGQTFRYQNLMYMTAGLVAERTTGQRWEELVAERLFAPLRMEASNFSVHDLQAAEDHALPYAEGSRGPRRISFRNLDAVAPSSSINSSVLEMARYVQFHLDGGHVGDRRLLSEDTALELRTPQVLMPESDEYPETGADSYGLGFVVGSYRGHQLVHHCGGVDGFVSTMSFMPEEGLGVVVLTNFSGQNPVPSIVARNVYDRLLNLGQVDWIARTVREERKAREAEEEERRAREAEERKAAANGIGTPAATPDDMISRPLAEYAGSFEHPAYGVAVVSVAGTELEINFHGINLPLASSRPDVFEVPTGHPFAHTPVSFLRAEDGSLDRIAIPLEPEVADVEFMRLALADSLGRESLERLVGEYGWGRSRLRVFLDERGLLMLSFDGSRAYELVHSKGMAFCIRGLSGYTIEFAPGGSGKSTELIVHQPSGAAVVKRLPDPDA